MAFCATASLRALVFGVLIYALVSDELLQHCVQKGRAMPYGAAQFGCSLHDVCSMGRRPPGRALRRAGSLGSLTRGVIPVANSLCAILLSNRDEPARGRRYVSRQERRRCPRGMRATNVRIKNARSAYAIGLVSKALHKTASIAHLSAPNSTRVLPSSMPATHGFHGARGAARPGLRDPHIAACQLPHSCASVHAGRRRSAGEPASSRRAQRTH